MKKKIYIGKYLLVVFLLLCGLITYFIWYFTGHSRDEVLIEKLLSGLCEDMSKHPGENPAMALVQIKSAAGAFAYPVTLCMDKYINGSFDEETVIAYAGRLRAMLKEAEFQYSDLHLELLSPESARGFFSGSFEGCNKSGFFERIVKEVSIEFVKIDGQWKIKKVSFVNVLH